MRGITKRQREILDFIDGYIANHRYSPSYREIQNHFGFSSLGSVYNHILTLKKKGILVESGPGARSLSVLKELKTTEIQIPLVGKLSGGMPIETFEHVTTLALPMSLVPSDRECYLIKVEGEGLLEESLLEGDLLLIQPKSDFEDGEMVIALVQGKTTLIKKGYSDPPYLRLESSHPQHLQPLILREDHVQIQGVVIALIRSYRSH